MFERGKIVLVPFPFTDLSAQKVRPALILSEPIRVKDHVIAAFITSKISQGEARGCVTIKSRTASFAQTGLKVPSLIRCDKIATLDKQIVLGEIGSCPAPIMKKINAALRFTLGLGKL